MIKSNSYIKNVETGVTYFVAQSMYVTKPYLHTYWTLYNRNSGYLRSIADQDELEANYVEVEKPVIPIVSGTKVIQMRVSPIGTLQACEGIIEGYNNSYPLGANKLVTLNTAEVVYHMGEHQLQKEWHYLPEILPKFKRFIL